MRTYEHSPFPDIEIPYLVDPKLSNKERFRRFREVLNYSTLPVLTRWIIYRTFKNLKTN